MDDPNFFDEFETIINPKKANPRLGSKLAEQTEDNAVREEEPREPIKCSSGDHTTLAASLLDDAMSPLRF